MERIKKIDSNYIRIIFLYLAFTAAMTAVGYAALRLLPYGDYSINPVKENWLNPFLRWDAIHYMNIAAMGYGVYIPGNYAFFPLYPMLIRGLTTLTGIPYAYSALLIARWAFLAAILALYRLGKEAYDEKTAFRSVLCLMLFPGAFFFLSAYTEALALLFAVCVFFFCRHNNWAAASLTVLLFGALKPLGILMGLIVLLFYLRRIEYNNRKIRPDILWLCLMPLGLLAYMAYLYKVKGNPLYFSYCEQFFGRHTALPGVPLLLSMKNFASSILAGAYRTLDQILLLKRYFIEVFMSLSVGAGLVYIYRRLDKLYFIYCLLMIAVPFSTSVSGGGLDGMLRYALLLFPLYFAAAKLFDYKLFRAAYITVGAVLNVVFMAIFACWYWVA